MTMRQEVVRTLVRSGPGWLLLSAVLYALWMISDYAIRDAVPAHLRAIQEGYEKIEDKQTDAIQLLSDKSDLEIKERAETRSAMREAVKEMGSSVEELSQASRELREAVGTLKGPQ